MKQIKRRILIVSFVLLSGIGTSYAGVRLASVFGSNMVLQRDEPLMIWGQADKEEQIRISFNGQQAEIRADDQGNWFVRLKPMHYGGPYTMEIRGDSTRLHLENILIGDVWLCSGQSNMEMPLEGWSGNPIKNSAEEIKVADYSDIRLFTVEDETAYHGKEDLKGGTWQVCTPKNAASFSAVSYFFGRDLHRDLNVPVGLINSSWGGTIIQTWISWDKLKTVGDYRQMDPDSFPEIAAGWVKNKTKYEQAMNHDPGLKEQWYQPGNRPGVWKEMDLPRSFGQSDLGETEGIVWFKKEVTLSENQAGREGHLNLGVVDDYDVTYVNGQQVGSIDDWYTPRHYVLEKGLLHAGKNEIIVKVRNQSGVGGFSGMPESMYLQIGKDTVSLSGKWVYRPSVTKKMYGVKDPGPNAFPSQLYNAMIAPLVGSRIKGVIWYQGESNTSEAAKYRTLFPMLINDWREKWGYRFPFLWVQLANFMAQAEKPGPSDWAMLREAQHRALKLPDTGEAVAIDLGEAKTIHPANKQDVGARLERIALKVAYGRHIEASGPELKQMNIKNGKAVLTFSHAKGGLVAQNSKDGKSVYGFAIAGADHHFFWANATIHGDRVIVSSSKVEKPVAIRYGWADNPPVNLYNKSGLPASPFRTDQW